MSTKLSFAPPPNTTQIGMTLETYILEGMLGFPAATGAFTSLLNQLSFAAKLVTSRVRRAGLANLFGYTGEVNIQGEQVQKLDVETNETLIGALARRGHCAAIASEELDEIRVLNEDPRAKYIVVFDPLDGSSNIDVNVSIGTIFGVLKRREGSTAATLERDFLRPGSELLAAGYVLYGSSTMLVITTGSGGVHGFTYDPTVGEFFLSHEHIRTPERGSIYSINEGNSVHWTDPVRRWNEWVKRDDKDNGLPYGLRYVGSMVADAHRTLLKGGVFAYPADHKSPKGKLRLLYEANPFAFIFEAAGGRASTGSGRILEVTPTDLHERTPVIMGSARDVEVFEQFLRGDR